MFPVGKVYGDAFCLNRLAIADISFQIQIFGCGGLANNATTELDSTAFPIYMTTALLVIWDKPPKWWVMNMIAMPNSVCGSLTSFRITAWVVRSNGVAGSPAIRSAGRHESPMAIMALALTAAEGVRVTHHIFRSLFARV